jgi:hypothetical protein
MLEDRSPSLRGARPQSRRARQHELCRVDRARHCGQVSPSGEPGGLFVFFGVFGHEDPAAAAAEAGAGGTDRAGVTIGGADEASRVRGTVGGAYSTMALDLWSLPYLATPFPKPTMMWSRHWTIESGCEHAVVLVAKTDRV